MKDNDETPVDDTHTIAALNTLKEWSDGQSYVSDLNELCEDMYEMFRGGRPEKNYDWQSNLVINKVFQVIYTAVPYIAQKVFGSTPIMGVKGPDKFDKAAKHREDLLEFWHTMQPTSTHTPFWNVFVLWTLRASLNGVGYIKKGWKQKLKSKTEEQDVVVPIPSPDGQGIMSIPHRIKKKISKPVEDWPVNIPVNNKDIVVDPLLKPGESVRQGRFVIHREVFDLGDLYEDGNYKNLEQIDAYAVGATSEEEDHAQVRALDDQVSRPVQDMYAEVELFERVGKVLVTKEDWDGFDYKPCYDKDEIGEYKYKDMILTVAKCGKKAIIVRFEPNPYEEINYIDMHIYLDPERWHSQGMVEPFKDVQTAINDNINAMFDKLWQELMPPVIVNKYALWDWDTMQYAPHQRWLVGGNPAESIYFKPPSQLPPDTWQKHALLDSEVQLTSMTNAMHGAGKEKTATTNVMNAQMSAGKLDFIIQMIEKTALIPSAQMDIRFAKKFAHKLTFTAILGEDFEIGDWEDAYKYVPAAGSVKMEHQKDAETQQDIQLIQLLSSMNNPKAAAVVNKLLGNIFKNRNMDEDARALLDEEYFEPQSDSGNIEMLRRRMGGKSNQNGIEMRGQETSVRESTNQPRRLIQ